MSNPIVAAIRSVVQALVSLAIVAIGNVVLTELGVEIDVVAITETVSLAVFAGLVWAFNALGVQFPIVNTILSLGFSADAASYEV